MSLERAEVGFAKASKTVHDVNSGVFFRPASAQGTVLKEADSADGREWFRAKAEKRRERCSALFRPANDGRLLLLWYIESMANKTWDERVFDRLPSGVDAASVRENLRLTPTERVEKMQRALDLALELRAAYANRPTNRSRSAR
jgi:hypothetical protein